MSTDLKAIMEFDQRRRQMLADPDLTGDLLLLALALDEVVRRQMEKVRRPKGWSWWHLVGALARGDADVAQAGWWVKDQIRRDLPRYESQQRGRGCVAPMIRREGLCGKSGSYGLADRDPLTGEGGLVWFCARHRHLGKAAEERTRQWAENGKPLPPANTGGVLKRYWDADWDHIYRWASGRDPMPGGREATPPRPKLRLIPGGADQIEEMPHGC